MIQVIFMVMESVYYLKEFQRSMEEKWELKVFISEFKVLPMEVEEFL